MLLEQLLDTGNGGQAAVGFGGGYGGEGGSWEWAVVLGERNERKCDAESVPTFLS